MEAIRVEDLNKEFGGIHATRNVSFCVEEGERIAIIGPNGAGKTTLFNLLGGQLSPSSGKVLFYNKDITHLKAHCRTRLGLARSFQIASLFMNLTVLDNLFLALSGTKHHKFNIYQQAKSYKSIYAKAEDILNSINLYSKKDLLVHSIAYGEQRKLELSLCLASEPKLLLLDEPSCGLTATESADITSQLNKLGEKITVILVAHDMDLVFGIAERIIVLHYGEIIMEGDCAQVCNSDKIKEIYMGMED